MAIDRLPAPGAGIPTTTVTAKGDLIAGTANNAVSRLGVGTNDQVLTADSTTATGLKWATPTSGGSTAKGCALYGNGDISVSSSTSVTINWPNEFFDTDGYHSTSSNTSRITIPTGLGGVYMVTGKVSWNTTNTGGDRRSVSINKNGAGWQNVAYAPTSYTGGVFASIMQLVAGDYLELIVWQDSGSTLPANNHQDNGFFSVAYLGA